MTNQKYSIKHQGAAALIVAAGSFEFRWSKQPISLAARPELPTICAGRELVNAGGLMPRSPVGSPSRRVFGIFPILPTAC